MEYRLYLFLQHERNSPCIAHAFFFFFLLQLGGPNYAVELGRLDGKTFNRAIVKHVLPGPGFNLDQLNSLFAQNGLTQTDMIALSGSSVL
jgi:hypothetical protein